MRGRKAKILRRVASRLGRGKRNRCTQTWGGQWVHPEGSERCIYQELKRKYQNGPIV